MDEKQRALASARFSRFLTRWRFGIALGLCVCGASLPTTSEAQGAPPASTEPEVLQEPAAAEAPVPPAPAPIYAAPAVPIAQSPQAYYELPPPARARRRGRDTSAAPVLTIGLGLGFGFLLDSGDQTRAIERWQNSQGDIVIQQEGFSDIILYFLPRFSLSYSPFRWGRLQGIFEYGWAPKLITVNGAGSRSFHYNRASAGLLASLEVPVRKNRLKAFDIGAGPFFHYVTFEGQSASALGAKVQASTFMRVGQKNQAEIFLAYDYAPASSGVMTLDYSSVSLGFVFHIALLTRE